MKRLLVALVLLAVATATAQTQFAIRCQDGYCVIRESDVDQLQRVINAIVERIQHLQKENEELKERMGCS